MGISKRRLYQLATLLILGGCLMLCQPFSVVFYSYGFPVVLLGTLSFIIIDHLPDWSKSG